MPEAENLDPDDLMARFELMVKERLAEWMAEETDDEERSRGSERFNNLLTDWTDSVKHHRAATGIEAAAHNRKLTLAYLNKIREILNQTNENAEQIQAVPQSGEGEGPPQEGQGEQEGEDPQNGEGEQEGGGGSGAEHGQILQGSRTGRYQGPAGVKVNR